MSKVLKRLACMISGHTWFERKCAYIDVNDHKKGYYGTKTCLRCCAKTTFVNEGDKK